MNRATSRLHSLGIRVPEFTLTTERESRFPFGGSFVDFNDCGRLNMGRYPTKFLRNWLAMHELGHLLWAEHQPLQNNHFRSAFGAPFPPDYEKICRSESWKTALALNLNPFNQPLGPGLHRPEGEPSWYGARAGGEERFCELIGLMWAHGSFSNPPADLKNLWDCCWTHGLARMNGS